MDKVPTPSLPPKIAWPDNAAFLSQIIETQNDVSAVELDSATVMQMIVDRTRKLANAEAAALELIEGFHLVYRAVSGSASEHLGMKLPISASLSGTCVTTGELIYCPDTLEDPRVNRDARQRTGIRSAVLVPLAYNNRIAGVLKVLSAKPNAFNDQTVLGLQLMAGLLGNALSHASEFEIKKALLEERTASFAALGESEERFRSAFDNAPIGMALVSLNGRWLQVNRSVCRILGYTESELLATTFQAITFPEDLDADLTYVRRLVANEIEHYQMTKRYVHKLGHTVWALLSVSLVRDETDKPLYFISQIQDMTDRHRVEEALRNSEEEYRAMFDLAGVGKMQVDLATGRFTRINRKFCEMLGYTREEALCLTFEQITHPDDRAPSRNAANAMIRGDLAEHTVEKRYIRKDGRILWVNLNAATIRGTPGKPARGVATIEDITQRKSAERLESDRRRILEMVVQDRPLDAILTQLHEAIQHQIPDSSVAMMFIRDGAISVLGTALPRPWHHALQHSAMPLSVKLAGHAWESAAGFSVSFPQSDLLWDTLRPLAAQNNINACWAFPVQSLDRSPTGLLCVFCTHSRGPTPSELQTLEMASKLATLCVDHHAVTHQLAHLVRHDSLTGLANRLMFEDRLEQALVANRAAGANAALLLLDIDRFKNINDTLGHQTGDLLLQQFAHRLRSLLRKEETLARLGGDEFAIILPTLTTTAQAVAVAQNIVSALNRPFDLPNSQSLQITASIGIAISPTHGDDSPSLQEIADAALYRVKAKGRNGYWLTP